MLFYDTESCGFHSPTLLIQWSDTEDLEDVNLHEIMFRPIRETLDLIQYITTQEVVGFNLTHDHYHLQRTYNNLTALAAEVGDNAEPIDHIGAMAAVEKDSRDGACVKVGRAVDLMLVARKGPYQTTMDRKPIRLKRVPSALAEELSKELGRRIPLPDILFARSAKASKWKIFPVQDWSTGKENPDFVDIVLRFNPSTALKLILIDAGLREKSRLKFEDIESAEMQRYKLIEWAWAPFAEAVSTPEKGWYWEKRLSSGVRKGWAWPKVIEHHAYHWRYNRAARTYAAEDTTDLKLLWNHFGCPRSDRDSVLACMAGSVRWKGFNVDTEKLQELRDEEAKIVASAPKSPHQVYLYLTEVMDSEDEINTLKTDKGNSSTKKVLLQQVSKWVKDCSCVIAKSSLITDEDGKRTYQQVKTPKPDCNICKGSGVIDHPAAKRAAACLKARQSQTKIALFDKLLIAGRMHASASIVGSLSGRQSGRTEVGDGKRAASLNALGIQNNKDIRRCFPMAFPGMILNAGDFDSYEIAIGDAAWKDEALRRELLTCYACGGVGQLSEFHDGLGCQHCHQLEYYCKRCKKSFVSRDQVCSCGAQCDTGEPTRRKIHGLFAMELFDKTYDEVIASKGTDFDMYKLGKGGVFGGLLYGGDEGTLARRMGIPEEIGKAAREKFFNRFKGIQAAQLRVYNNHCSMRQEGGIGSRVSWAEPREYCESLTGFRRYFTLENKITKALYDLAEEPPKEWLTKKGMVRRRDRDQTITGAMRSATFAAAFQIQAACMRAALNHELQSTGAEKTKDLQYELWELQPSGVGEWEILTLNVHDEIVAPSLPKHREACKTIVHDFCVKNRDLIPFLKMDWSSDLQDWAEK